MNIVQWKKSQSTKHVASKQNITHNKNTQMHLHKQKMAKISIYRAWNNCQSVSCYDKEPNSFYHDSHNILLLNQTYWSNQLVQAFLAQGRKKQNRIFALVLGFAWPCWWNSYPIIRFSLFPIKKKCLLHRLTLNAKNFEWTLFKMANISSSTSIQSALRIIDPFQMKSKQLNL